MKERVVLILVAAGLLVAADTKEDAVKKDKVALQGAWKVEAYEDGGKSTPEEELKDTCLIFKGDKLLTKKKQKIVDEVAFKLDPSQKPQAIDLLSKTGEESDAIKGIYELNDDALRICLAGVSSQARPTGFATKEGSNTCLITLKRKNS
jgi:uncharacterized protein (TIGR03067 family)